MGHWPGWENVQRWVYRVGLVSQDNGLFAGFQCKNDPVVRVGVAVQARVPTQAGNYSTAETGRI